MMFDFKPVDRGFVIMWEGQQLPLVGWWTDDGWLNDPLPVVASDAAGIHRLPRGEHDWALVVDE